MLTGGSCFAKEIYMLRKLTPEQAQRCNNCEWRDKTNDSVVICPWAGRCIKGDDEGYIPTLPKSS